MGAKQIVEEREQKFVAKMVMQEATECVKGLESKLESTIEVAKPLVEEGGKAFVVASMSRMILEALNEYMNQKHVTKDYLFALVTSIAKELKEKEKEERKKQNIKEKEEEEKKKQQA